MGNGEKNKKKVTNKMSVSKEQLLEFIHQNALECLCIPLPNLLKYVNASTRTDFSDAQKYMNDYCLNITNDPITCIDGYYTLRNYILNNFLPISSEAANHLQNVLSAYISPEQMSVKGSRRLMIESSLETAIINYDNRLQKVFRSLKGSASVSLIFADLEDTNISSDEVTSYVIDDSISISTSVGALRTTGVQIISGGPFFRLILGDVFVADDIHIFPINNFTSVTVIYEPSLSTLVVWLTFPKESLPQITFFSLYSAEGIMSEPSFGDAVISVENGSAIAVRSRYGTVTSMSN